MFSEHQLLLLQEERQRALAREWQQPVWLYAAEQAYQRERGQKSVMTRLVLLVRGITSLVRARVTTQVSRKEEQVHGATGAELPISFQSGLGVDSSDSQAA